MKALVLYLALSTGLAIGSTACAHQQLTNQQVARTAVPVALVIGAIVIGAMYDRNGFGPGDPPPQ